MEILTMDAKPLEHIYLMRVTIEVYDCVDVKTRRYATPAEHFLRVFTARDDEESRVKQAHCWPACGIAVYTELPKESEK